MRHIHPPDAQTEQEIARVRDALLATAPKVTAALAAHETRAQAMICSLTNTAIATLRALNLPIDSAHIAAISAAVAPMFVIQFGYAARGGVERHKFIDADGYDDCTGPVLICSFCDLAIVHPPLAMAAWRTSMDGREIFYVHKLECLPGLERAIGHHLATRELSTWLAQLLHNVSAPLEPGMRSVLVEGYVGGESF